MKFSRAKKYDIAECNTRNNLLNFGADLEYDLDYDPDHMDW